MPHLMIIEARYYEDISELLLKGAVDVIAAKRSTYEIFQVPGALEIPLAIKMGMLRPTGTGSRERKFDGYVALGCVLRGETSHYDIVCNESARGLGYLSLKYDIPIGNGILTCDTHEQALERADPAKLNKGADAVNAALALVNLRRILGLMPS